MYLAFPRILTALLLLSGCGAIRGPGGKLENTTVEKIAAQGDSLQLAVIFIHGIFSNGIDGWTSRESEGTYFPKLLCTDPAVPNCTSFAVSYYSPRFKQSGSLDQVARQVERTLQFANIFADYRHVVLVGHSMGGLIARKIAVGLNTVGNAEALRRLKGVITLATPTRGAPIANLNAYLRVSNQLAQLDPDSYRGWLSDLDLQVAKLKAERDSQRTYFPRFVAAHELLSTLGVTTVPEFYTQGAMDGIVEPMTATHSKISTPRDRSAEVYLWVRNQINGYESRPDDLPDESLAPPDLNLVDAFGAAFTVGAIIKRPKPGGTRDMGGSGLSIVDTSIAARLTVSTDTLALAGIVQGRSVWLRPGLDFESGSLATRTLAISINEAFSAWTPESEIEKAMSTVQMTLIGRVAQTSDTLYVPWSVNEAFEYRIVTRSIRASQLSWWLRDGTTEMPLACDYVAQGRRRGCTFPQPTRVLYASRRLLPVKVDLGRSAFRVDPDSAVAWFSSSISLPAQGSDLGSGAVLESPLPYAERRVTELIEETIEALVSNVQELRGGGGIAIVDLARADSGAQVLEIVGREWARSVRTQPVCCDGTRLRLTANSWLGNEPVVGQAIRMKARVGRERSIVEQISDTQSVRLQAVRVVAGSTFEVVEEQGKQLRIELTINGRRHVLTLNDTIEDEYFRVLERIRLATGQIRYRVQSKGAVTARAVS